MRIAYITAGAAGMYCGSCMHDNTLVASLHKMGHDAVLIPTYTPIRTDEQDVSQKRVFIGGINAYLQQNYRLFRRTPWFVDRLLDAKWLLRWVSRFAVKTQAEDLGDLAVSMLKGEHGFQRKEIAKLVHWLRCDFKPEIVNLTNVLLSGLAPELKKRLGVPLIATLQGDDVFLEALPEDFRKQAIDLIREHCREIDGFIATSNYYADFMSGYLDIPRDRIHVVYPGLNFTGYEQTRAERNGTPYTIGYFARICPEKGLHNLVDAFAKLKQAPGAPPSRLRASGWLGENQRPYLNDLIEKLRSQNLHRDFEYVESPGHADKVRFFQSIDVLSVPTTYHEPKGLYILEALANGVPVVQPRHGSFPELIEATGGGLLVEPGNADSLHDALHRLMNERDLRSELAIKGRAAVRDRFTAEKMANETLAVYQKYMAD